MSYHVPNGQLGQVYYFMLVAARLEQHSWQSVTVSITHVTGS